MINLCDRTRRRRARARAGFVYSRLEELFCFFSFLSLFFSQSKNGRRRIGLTSGEARLRRRRGRRFNSGYTPVVSSYSTEQQYMGYYPDWLRIGSRSHLSHVEFYHIEDTNIVSPFSIWKTSSSPFPRFLFVNSKRTFRVMDNLKRRVEWRSRTQQEHIRWAVDGSPPVFPLRI